MPLYEYRCSKCDKTFEVIQKFADSPLTEHEGCGGAVERLLSAPAFQLKGTGWYVTDYGKGGTKSGDSSADGKSSDKKPSESQPSSGSSETKSEAKGGESNSTESKAETKAPAAKSSD
jgi:putative FmdB family regulatory protein